MPKGTALYAQGCSDAGICTFDKAFRFDTIPKNGIEITPIIARGEANTLYFSPTVAYTRRLGEVWAFNAKVTYSQAHGDFGTRGQFGDLILSANYRLEKKWNVFLGTKIPFSASNLKINGVALPMDYQSSLGTVDLLVGGTLSLEGWEFTSSLQLPVWNFNRNSYFKEYAPTVDFPTTNLFKRKADLLVRGAYKYAFSKKLYAKPSIIGIYHLGEDSYEDIYGHRQPINGSEGATINGVITTTYNFYTNHTIELLAATPFVVRDVRPDGLTRQWVVSASYQIQF